ncbi:hypothetical protein ACIRPK_10305 [Kitasatospora sp. NPDC101801]|uniref:hypothetical protein n=1 Tax=Kitasatospora sp. NPDC101801 TaxID=3364103 RepID=UPI00381B432F
MVDVLLQILVSSVLTPGFGAAKRKVRKLTKAFEAGEAVTFAGCVFGMRPYCRPVLGFLTASPTTLATSPTEAPGLNSRPIPLSQVEPVRVRDREGTDPVGIPRGWKVTECRDGEDTVLFACAPEYLPLLTAVLESGRQLTR